MDDFGTRTACKATETLPMWSHVFSFGLGGIIVPSEAVHEISSATNDLCARWDVPVLHGNKIRGARGSFGFLKKDENKKARFFQELEELLIDDRITAHACVICRPGYRDRYHDKHPEGVRWQMSRTAFDISVERAAKYARSLKRKLSVVYERTGETEDRLIEGYFQRLRTTGTEFSVENSAQHSPMSSSDLADTLMSIWPDGKGNPMLQLADLVVHPLGHRPTGLRNRAYDRFVESGQLLDARTDDPTISIKYSCYDDPYKEYVAPEGNPRNT
ncbi:DUF3800 domain-containing protein [Ensifer sp. MPMI2T]|nr:DUF3800 domain-containing protein [Ensifer sp. MPMI2T]